MRDGDGVVYESGSRRASPARQPHEVAYDADLHDEVFVFSGFRDG